VIVRQPSILRSAKLGDEMSGLMFFCDNSQVMVARSLWKMFGQSTTGTRSRTFPTDCCQQERFDVIIRNMEQDHGQLSIIDTQGEKRQMRNSGWGMRS
jgi:hypothetical protein